MNTNVFQCPYLQRGCGGALASDPWTGAVFQLIKIHGQFMELWLEGLVSPCTTKVQTRSSSLWPRWSAGCCNRRDGECTHPKIVSGFLLLCRSEIWTAWRWGWNWIQFFWCMQGRTTLQAICKREALLFLKWRANSYSVFICFGRHI